MEIDIKNKFTKNVIFSHNVKNNTIKLTVKTAILHGADLHGADLCWADLCGANLCEADLCEVDLRWVIGNSKEIKLMKLCEWDIVFTKDYLAIGCKQFKISEWKSFSNSEIKKLDKNAFKFMLKWKEVIFQVIEQSFNNNNG